MQGELSRRADPHGYIRLALAGENEHCRHDGRIARLSRRARRGRSPVDGAGDIDGGCGVGAGGGGARRHAAYAAASAHKNERESEAGGPPKCAHGSILRPPKKEGPARRRPLVGFLLRAEERHHTGDQVRLLRRGAVLLKREGEEDDLVTCPAKESASVLRRVIGEDADRAVVGRDLVHELVSEDRVVEGHGADAGGQSRRDAVDVVGRLVVLGLASVPRDVEVVVDERRGAAGLVEQVLARHEQAPTVVEERLESRLVRGDRVGVRVAREPDDVLEGQHELIRDVVVGIQVPRDEWHAGRCQRAGVEGLDVRVVAVLIDEQRRHSHRDRLHRRRAGHAWIAAGGRRYGRRVGAGT